MVLVDTLTVRLGVDGVLAEMGGSPKETEGATRRTGAAFTPALPAQWTRVCTLSRKHRHVSFGDEDTICKLE